MEKCRSDGSVGVVGEHAADVLNGLWVPAFGFGSRDLTYLVSEED
jgi:hypothetical protein